jgi:hypothetical protein
MRARINEYAARQRVNKAAAAGVPQQTTTPKRLPPSLIPDGQAAPGTQECILHSRRHARTHTRHACPGHSPRTHIHTCRDCTAKPCSQSRRRQPAGCSTRWPQPVQKTNKQRGVVVGGCTARCAHNMGNAIAFISGEQVERRTATTTNSTASVLSHAHAALLATHSSDRWQ